MNIKFLIRFISRPYKYLYVNYPFPGMCTRITICSLYQESNFTTFGTSKPLGFLNRFRSGWLPSAQSKIAYVLLSHFKEEGHDNGWYADAYIRMYLSKRGLPLVEGARDDDLFVLSDADELPTREALLFLKLYDG